MTTLNELFPDFSAPQTAYSPASMKFDGNLDYLTLWNVQLSSQTVTMILRFKWDETAGSDGAYLFNGGYASNVAVATYFYEASHANAGKVGFAVGTSLCILVSENRYDDGEWHCLLASYDGAAGEATFLIDHIDADDTGYGSRVLTTGTIYNDSRIDYRLGIAWWDAPSAATSFTGQCNATGLHNTYITDSTLFFNPDNTLKELDESGWTEWGTQPKIWNEHGDLRNNLGSWGNAGSYGNIHVAPAERPV